jgi:hypothetical protein
MSLVRLLTAGKSLVGIQDSKSRYRSVDPRALPKFGSEKKLNTDIARESEAKPSVATSNVDSSKGSVEKMPAATARKVRGSGWVSQWGSKLSSLVSQKPKPARSAVPRFNGVPIQGELSLDNIKVVRNDLSDADLEVVTRKMAPPNEEVGRASSRDDEFARARGPLAARGDARPTMSTMFSAVNP